MRVAVIIPCYKVAATVEAVVQAIDPSTTIVCVDDACPEGSGAVIERLGMPHVTVLYHAENRGVGGAVKTGYAHVLAHTTADAVVKVDGDGQMPPADVARLIRPIAEGRADYVKGNRFYDLRYLKHMPTVRLLGNGALSFFSKLSSGYWDLMDPTNGFVAISREALVELDLDEIDNRYFFESDMLCKLYLLGAVVCEFPMHAQYAGAPSSMRPLREIVPFLHKHARNTLRRIFYSYFVRDFNAGSLALILSVTLGLIATIYGSLNWLATLTSGQARASGTVILSALGVILSIQFLIFFLTVDMQNNPNLKPNRRIGR